MRLGNDAETLFSRDSRRDGIYFTTKPKGEAMSTVAKTSKPTELSKFLAQLKSQIELALPKHMSADRMCRLALTQFSSNPMLQKCTFQSIAACVMLSSQTGLEIGVNGHAYMIPYGETATFVPGWKGLMDLVNRNGKANVWTGAVFDGDEFDWALGDAPFVLHRPTGESDPDKMLFAYAIGRIKGSEYPVIECWPNARLLKHRDQYNKVGRKHYSFSNWEMYARKVVLLQVLKYMPQSVELSTAIQAEYESERPSTVEGKVISGLDDLTDRLIASQPEPKPESEVVVETAEEKPEVQEVPASLFEDLEYQIKGCDSQEQLDELEKEVEAEYSKFSAAEKKAIQKVLKEASERIGK